MENPDAKQLPEVDSLPDGFVDSPTEHLAPQTPTFEQEKHVNNRKDVVSELEHSNEASLEITAGESQKSHEVPDESCVEQTEGTAVMPKPAVVSKASVRVSECSELKEQAQGSSQSSEKSIEGGSDVNTTHRKETSSESTDTLRNGKQEASETKRKNTKRSFKSEKEFLEFTLKYQQVLAERDSDFEMSQVILVCSWAKKSVVHTLESIWHQLGSQNDLASEFIAWSFVRRGNAQLEVLQSVLMVTCGWNGTDELLMKRKLM